MKLRTVAGTAVLAAVMLAVSGGAATAAGSDDSAAQLAASAKHPVPEAVRVPAGHVLVGDHFAKGVQVYQCTAGAWTFVEPAASLIGWAPRPGRFSTVIHFRGPSWESVDDGSLVEAKAVANSPVPGSIPQLLLESTKNRGDGVFGKVRYIQRLATSGGAAPAGACTDGQTTGVPYRAEYRFFAPAK
jgi:hypothetical protein